MKLLFFALTAVCTPTHYFKVFGFSVQDEKGKEGEGVCVRVCDVKTFLHNHIFPEKTACLVLAIAMPRVEQMFIN